LDELRNPVAHSRDLVPFEEALVRGISGEIRQQITLYLSHMAGEDRYFPRVERVQDSFGNVAGGADAGQITIARTRLILHPGDTVTFSGHAWDPEGLGVQWLFNASGATLPIGPPSLGFLHVWEVTDDDIRESCIVSIGITSQRSYHRSANSLGDDDRCMFGYTVLPSSPPGSV
jgi:hypothetical protein